MTSRTKKYEVQFSDGTEEGERNLTVFETYNPATPNRKKKEITVVWTKSDLKNEKRKRRTETPQGVTNETGILDGYEQ